MTDKSASDQISLGLGTDKRQGQLGTFLGVFTPTILTILGVIMYLRFGWVVGQVGLSTTLIIVLLANSITIATAFSLSAVATNSRVGVGGAYYIISRSLGVEIGGAIGLPLFLSQALSVTLYAFGLAESLRIVWPEIHVPTAAFVIIILVGLLSFKGAMIALKAQIPVMLMIGISILALAGGTFLNPHVTTLPSPQEIPPAASFWGVFAVFFPAVTGIMAGLSLSGDLADTRRAIPRGTLLAALTGLLVYLLLPILLHFGADRATLLTEPLVWTKISLLGPWLVLPGLWGAIFSSAVGSMLGAPRTLQALSLDRLTPLRLAGKVRGGEEPVLGMAVTVSLSLLAVFLGDLNTVATVVTMFFLSVYGIINLVATLEYLSGNPSWRPTLEVHWSISLLGAFGCFGVMVLIHWPSTIAALAIEFILWLWFRRQTRLSSWGDLRRDLYESLIRWALIRLSRHPLTARNWRPHLLVFVRDIEQRLNLVRFASWFSEDRGVVTVSEMVIGDVLTTDMDYTERQSFLQNVLDREGIVAFGEVNVVQDVERGILAVSQANGMAGLESNTIMLGFPEDQERLAIFLKTLRSLQRLKRSLVIGKIERLRAPREGVPRIIHVWWGGLKRNSDLMLLLSYLLTCNSEWRDARIRILSIASNELMKAHTEQALACLIPQIRIDADIEVTVRGGKENIQDIIRQKSFAADVVFLGLATPEEGKEEEYALRLQNLVEFLPTCFLVNNGSLFIGELITPDESAATVQEKPPADDAVPQAESNREPA
ncbi:MAG: hypothetical protein PHI06_03065 [Desulfobulbaceae bacterium]|nr:hypothetical protein [Desulfobulbaceae bacterium]